MLWHKGVDDFVVAARLLRAEGVDVEFVLAGDTDSGNPGAISTSDLERWHAEGAVRWLGHVDDMRTAYAESAIVCLPSKYGEGVPRALIEGAATGRPLVTTDTPGCRDIARHGFNGFCVPPGDPPALAAAIRSLVDDPALRLTMGRRGRAIAEEEFSLAAVRARTLELYAELLA
jgi:glycosyltransferase involved in cell wall biosynthesis